MADSLTRGERLNGDRFKGVERGDRVSSSTKLRTTGWTDLGPFWDSSIVEKVNMDLGFTIEQLHQVTVWVT